MCIFVPEEPELIVYVRYLDDDDWGNMHIIQIRHSLKSPASRPINESEVNDFNSIRSRNLKL